MFWWWREVMHGNFHFSCYVTDFGAFQALDFKVSAQPYYIRELPIHGVLFLWTNWEVKFGEKPMLDKVTGSLPPKPTWSVAESIRPPLAPSWGLTPSVQTPCRMFPRNWIQYQRKRRVNSLVTNSFPQSQSKMDFSSPVREGREERGRHAIRELL